MTSAPFTQPPLCLFSPAVCCESTDARQRGGGKWILVTHAHTNTHAVIWCLLCCDQTVCRSLASDSLVTEKVRPVSRPTTKAPRHRYAHWHTQTHTDPGTDADGISVWQLFSESKATSPWLKPACCSCVAPAALPLCANGGRWTPLTLFRGSQNVDWRAPPIIVASGTVIPIQF